MLDKLKNMLEKIDADYADIRYEIKKNSSIVFDGKKLLEIGSNSTDGFIIRVLKNGGMSSISFTKEKDAEKAIQTVQENAKLVSSKIQKPISLAKVEAVQETFLPEQKEDPREISIEEKLDLIR